MSTTAAHAQITDMSSLWPNADGNSWTYDQHYQNSNGPLDNQLRLTLVGATVAPNGIDAQVLRAEVIGAVLPASVRPGLIQDAFLANLWEARPDLRAGIAEALATLPCPTSPVPGGYSILLSGNLAYRKTADEIAAWRCNFADTRSWLWLVSDLTPGNTFTLQLVPDLASDVYLHGTVVGLEDVTVPAGTYTGSLRVDYRIDYGTSECTDQGGNIGGTFRSETRGSVHYAPDVGPVKSDEEFIPYVEATGTCADPGEIGMAASHVSLALASQPVPVRPMTWGQVKMTYR